MREIIAGSVNVILQFRYTSNGSHQLGEIVEIHHIRGDKFKLATMFKLECVKTKEGNSSTWQPVPVETESHFVNIKDLGASRTKLEGSQSPTDIAEELRANLEYFKQAES